LKERDVVDDLGVDGIINLKCLLNKWEERREFDLCGLGQCHIAGCCAHDNETTFLILSWVISLQAEELLDPSEEIYYLELV
jgi:hypothetical protein